MKPTHRTVAMIAWLLAAFVARSAIAQGLSPNRTSAQAPSPSLRTLLSAYWEDSLRDHPETATALGDERYNDRWSDLSVAELERSLRRKRQYLKRLQQMDVTGLSIQEKLSAALLLRNLREDLDSARYKEWEMPLNQIHGIHFELPQLVAVTPFDTVSDFDNYITRLRAVPPLFTQLTRNMRRGIRDGRVQPRLVSEKVLAQIEAILAIPLEESPFTAPLRNFPNNLPAAEQQSIARKVNRSVSQDVLPAYRKLAAFLKSTYIPHGRSEPGIWSIPDGDSYYAFCIQRNTTLAMTAEQIHQIGLEEVKRDAAAMRAIARNLGFEDLKTFNASIEANPRLHPASREQLLDTYRRDLDQMKAKLPELFGDLPNADLIVEATPAYTEKQRPAATYEAGSGGAKRPGRVVVNTYDLAHIALGDVESIAYHEGIPGHHLQFSIAQARSDLPDFRRHQEYTAYTEGWALYAEQLAKDVGFYQDPYSDYGRLQSDLWRAIRLVVDTGLHSQHWTRQQVVDYFHEHSSIDETNVQRETDRYIAWPGQALGYKIGQLELLKLRQRARARLGAQYDVKKFHAVILGSGALPLDVLDTYFDDLIATHG